MYAFISHSHSDKTKANDLAAWLKKQEIPYFIDSKEVRIGNQISSAVRDAIEKTTHFIILLSPESVQSKWVNYELGVAEGIAIGSKRNTRVLPWVVYPVRALPSFLGDRRWVDSLEDIKMELLEDAKEEWASKKIMAAAARNYIFNDIEIPAIRLIGADDEYFPSARISIECSDAPYSLPPRMQESSERIIVSLTEDAKRRNAPFFNGPHTRLIDFNFTVVDEITEQKKLELTLGPVGWYDFSVAEWHTERASKPQLSQWVDIEKIRMNGTCSPSSLPNILDTATTLFTRDGVLVYAQRGDQVSSGSGLLTSAVAENIHAVKDHSLSESENSVLPSPFRAALRGVEEELSPALRKLIEEESCPLLCLGLSYSLRDYHPNILFLSCVPCSFSELLSKCRHTPGRDFFEGKLLGASLVHPGVELDEALANPNWTGGGKASFFRALEFIRSWCDKQGVSVIEAHGQISKLPQ